MMARPQTVDPATLFTPCLVGAQALQHRVVLAPMTRTRADARTLAPTAETERWFRNLRHGYKVDFG